MPRTSAKARAKLRTDGYPNFAAISAMGSPVVTSQNDALCIRMRRTASATVSPVMP